MYIIRDMSNTETITTAPNTVVINGRTYEQRRLYHLQDGDVVLASYEAPTATWMPGAVAGFFFNYDADTIADAGDRQYNRIQRWEVENRKMSRFSLKRAKSGTRPKYANVSFTEFRNRNVWVEVK